MRWTVLVPLKSLPGAKSRLVAATVGAAEHADLVRAMRADTLAAARAATTVARVVVVADEPIAVTGDDPRTVLVQALPGLNSALSEGAAHASRHWPDDGIAALVGDLPTLTAADLDDVLREAALHERSFVADAAGTGTTLLAATPGVELAPSFGADSAARHRALAHPISARPGARCDIDTVEDLQAARRIGLGPHTRAALEALGALPA